MPGSEVSKSFCCAVCRSPSSTPFLTDCRDLYLHKPYVVDYFACQACGLVQQHPMPQDISQFYEAYPIHKEKPGVYSSLRRLLLSGVYVSPSKWPSGTVLLDFGCGDGWYLRWCGEKNVQAVGFEYSESHARSLSSMTGLDVFWDLDELEQRYAGRFDIITLHFVVEHLTDFPGTIRRLCRLLKKGGSIRYVVPDIHSWEFRVFRRSWHGLDPPRHVIFPSRDHASQVARDSGLELCDDRAVRFPNGFGGSISTAMFDSFNATAFVLFLPIALLVTWLFPGGNRAYLLRRT